MMGNNRGCDKQEELVTYLYGESTPEAAKQFEAHIHECLTCARELREFSSLRDTLQSWDVDTLPHIVIEPKKTFGMVLRELLTVTPFWAKGFAAAAALLIFAALLNVELTVGNFKVGAHLFAKSEPARVIPQDQTPGLTMADVNKLVDQRLADSQRQYREEMQVKLTELKQDLRAGHEKELAAITASLRQDQQRQIPKIVRNAIVQNELSFTGVFNDLDSDKNSNKDQDK